MKDKGEVVNSSGISSILLGDRGVLATSPKRSLYTPVYHKIREQSEMDCYHNWGDLQLIPKSLDDYQTDPSVLSATALAFFIDSSMEPVGDEFWTELIKNEAKFAKREYEPGKQGGGYVHRSVLKALRYVAQLAQRISVERDDHLDPDEEDCVFIRQKMNTHEVFTCYSARLTEAIGDLLAQLNNLSLSSAVTAHTVGLAFHDFDNPDHPTIHVPNDLLEVSGMELKYRLTSYPWDNIVMRKIGVGDIMCMYALAGMHQYWGGVNYDDDKLDWLDVMAMHAAIKWAFTDPLSEMAKPIFEDAGQISAEVQEILSHLPLPYLAMIDAYDIKRINHNGFEKYRLLYNILLRIATKYWGSAVGTVSYDLHGEVSADAIHSLGGMTATRLSPEWRFGSDSPWPAWMHTTTFPKGRGRGFWLPCRVRKSEEEDDGENCKWTVETSFEETIKDTKFLESGPLFGVSEEGYYIISMTRNNSGTLLIQDEDLFTRILHPRPMGWVRENPKHMSIQGFLALYLYGVDVSLGHSSRCRMDLLIGNEKAAVGPGMPLDTGRDDMEDKAYLERGAWII